jgi:hypothetical protein
MKKYILGFGLPLTALSLMSFAISSNSSQDSYASYGGSINITCLECDNYICYEVGGVTVYKGVAETLLLSFNN